MPTPAKSHKGPVHPFDTRYGVETSGLIPGRVIARGTGLAVEELTAYYGVAPSILDALVDIWLQRTAPPHPISAFTFLDVGAGKGRALMVASLHPFLRVEGIELNAALAAAAAKNIAVWNAREDVDRLAPIALQHGDATLLPLPAGPTVAFLFHPFEEPVMRRFLRHVARSLAAAPRAFDLVYVNTEVGSLLDRQPTLHKLWEGLVPMSPADHVADLAAIAAQKEYGSTGDELCAIYRFQPAPAKTKRSRAK
jgi:SAM-dependent methyltransferase